MKRFISALLITLLLLPITGCGKSGNKEDALAVYNNAFSNLALILRNRRVKCTVSSTMTNAIRNETQVSGTQGVMAVDMRTEDFLFSAETASYRVDGPDHEKAKAVSAAIENLPLPEEATPTDTDAVKSVRENYNQLSGAGCLKVENYKKLVQIEQKLGIAAEESTPIDGTIGEGALFCDGQTYYIFSGNTTYKMPIEDVVRSEIYKSVSYDLSLTESEVRTKSLKKTDDGYEFAFSVNTAVMNPKLTKPIVGAFRIPYDVVNYTSYNVKGQIDSEGVIYKLLVTLTCTSNTSDGQISVIIETEVTYDPLETGYEFTVPALISANTNVIETDYTTLKNSSGSSSSEQ